MKMLLFVCNYTETPFSDIIIKQMIKDRVNEDVIHDFRSYCIDQEYDTDALMIDIEDEIGNISDYVNDNYCLDSIRKLLYNCRCMFISKYIICNETKQNENKIK